MAQQGHHRHMLTGLRIIDFTRVLAGPYCTALMADLGAEVIKIESPAGDDYRHIGPFRDGESLLFQSINRGKLSVVMDLKNPRHVERLLGLVATADAVIENFRPGVMDRLGLGHERLCGLNRRLVYVSLSGFGQTGPNAHRPAYDIIVQAMSGIMNSTGDPQGPPTMIGEAIGDVAGGLFAAWAMMTALFERQQTGRGRYVDVALFDSLLAMMPIIACRAVTADADPTRTGNHHALSAPFGVFAASDGYFALAVLNDKLFATFSQAIARPDLPGDARFTSDAARKQNEGELIEIIQTWAASRSVRQVVDELAARGIPVGRLDSARQAWHGEQATARGMTSLVQHPHLGALPVFEQPAHFSGVPRGNRAPAPALNQHRSDIFPDWTHDDDV